MRVSQYSPPEVTGSGWTQGTQFDFIIAKDAPPLVSPKCETSRRGRGDSSAKIAVYYSLKVQFREAFGMSVAEATTPLRLEQSASASEEAELARRFLHFMSMMREVEDRIERKLYRQAKTIGRD